MEGGRCFPCLAWQHFSHSGPLLNHIMKRGRLTEREASLIVRDIANGLNFMHSKGMSHRWVAEEGRRVMEMNAFDSLET